MRAAYYQRREAQTGAREMDERETVSAPGDEYHSEYPAAPPQAPSMVDLREARVAELSEECARLRAALGEARAELVRQFGIVRQLRQETEEQREGRLYYKAAVERLREALAFYADERHWERESHDVGASDVVWEYVGPACDDGERARAALARGAR